MKTDQHKSFKASTPTVVTASNNFVDELVITVDDRDIQTGVMNKMDAHINGVLHRAFSVFIFNSNKELLLQKRAIDKYHSGGLWTNTCCSHPRPGENISIAAQRRLYEEMGIQCELSHAFSFIYKATVNNNLHEHELDHLFIGRYDHDPVINDAEVDDWKFQSLDSIKLHLHSKPNEYTEWFKICFNRVQDFLSHCA